MERKWVLIGVLILAVLLVLVPEGTTSARGPEPPDSSVQVQANVSPAAVVNSRISYQGMFEESGQPVTGSRDMVFRLYSDSACTTQVGTDIAQNGVQVAGGLFNVELPVTHGDFDGQGLWLSVRVGPTTWIGCQEVLPVPYALSLRPGAVIEGAPGANWLLEARTGTETNDVQASLVGPLYAVQGTTSLGVGVLGEARGATGLAGVYGTCNYHDSYGGHFVNTAGGQAGYFEGDVGQRRTDDGLVKAAVYAQCANTGSTVNRYFNNVNSSAITISNGGSAGYCLIDFNFTVNDRYWTASAYGVGVTSSVTCDAVTTDQLRCLRWDTSGNGVNGGIMVVIN